jgi:hypothetical protein
VVPTTRAGVRSPPLTLSVSLVDSSFRDPAGFLFRRDGRLFRQVNEVFRDDFEQLSASGLYERLANERLLVRHRDVSLDLAAGPEAYRVLEPEQIPFISYPYEWSFGELRDAALLTLRVQRLAMEHGMSLRDASAFNVQFVGARPILIDTLSFERLVEGRPWVAYRQFCQHFLAPLALMAHRDDRLGRLWQLDVEGVPLDLAGRLLPRHARLRFGLLVHVVLHGRNVLRHANDPALSDAAKERRFSPRAFAAMVESLESTVRRLKWREVPTAQDERAPEDAARLEALLERFLDTTQPAMVWDLSAGTGRLSRLAATGKRTVIAFDRDHANVEAAYRQAAAGSGDRVLPLRLDLANPTPPIGWANRERHSLSERGPADLALLCGSVHELAIANNVPLDRLASFLGDIARSLVVEFVPKDDPAVAPLLAAREDIFSDYRQDTFEHAFGRYFRIAEIGELPRSGRTVYLMRAT